MASLVPNYGSDEDSSYTDSDDNVTISTTAQKETEDKANQNFFDAGASSSDEDDKEDVKTDDKNRLPNPMLGSLPQPVFDADNEKELLSVFTNPYEQAEQAKNTVLEKHVKMVERNIPKGKAGQVCFKYKKGKCPYGKNCRYSHDLSSELISKPPAMTEEKSVFDFHHHSVTVQKIEPELEDDDNYMANAKRKKRSGITDNLLPPKRALKSLDKQRQTERPWTVSDK
ncbi:uncharacterized protein LOC133205563 [Saccostrea echinata]|uniref:uncharacterized protein LOC133188327 n=1 Tax=Saccostrea echinata TaxID=191078 RepID=UPI002A80158E|nr:uncharacterized protein LOC133188327 [Saccostrea echinata]XP_061197384.1 uncharacterized protein LOC133205563 [Saccostrea echinata]